MSHSRQALYGRLGGCRTSASHSPRDYTKKAREAFLASFEAQVDPDGLLPEAERTRRASAARTDYFTRLGIASGRARAARRGSRP